MCLCTGRMTMRKLYALLMLVLVMVTFTGCRYEPTNNYYEDYTFIVVAAQEDNLYINMYSGDFNLTTTAVPAGESGVLTLIYDNQVIFSSDNNIMAQKMPVGKEIKLPKEAAGDRNYKPVAIYGCPNDLVAKRTIYMVYPGTEQPIFKIGEDTQAVVTSYTEVGKFIKTGNGQLFTVPEVVDHKVLLSNMAITKAPVSGFKLLGLWWMLIILGGSIVVIVVISIIGAVVESADAAKMRKRWAADEAARRAADEAEETKRKLKDAEAKNTMWITTLDKPYSVTERVADLRQKIAALKSIVRTGDMGAFAAEFSFIESTLDSITKLEANIITAEARNNIGLQRNIHKLIITVEDQLIAIRTSSIDKLVEATEREVEVTERMAQ